MSDLLATIPDQYLLQDQAPTPRTLWDVVCDSAEKHPEAAAIDDGEILTYAELIEDVEAWAAELRSHGVMRGDHIGIRMTSGQRDLYLAILATLAAGAAYVPVDADDPDERAEMVFGEAGINGIFTDEGFRKLNPSAGVDQDEPHLDDTAWIIFTSGSTGKPKGVAVTHRSAAAFVDAEAALFLQANPLGPEDRVLAGLRCLRRILRRDVAGMGPWRLPSSSTTFFGPLRHGLGPVAHSPRYHGGLHRSYLGGTVACRGFR